MNKGAAELLIYMAGRVIEDRKTEPDTIIDWRSEIFDYAYDSGSLGSQEPGATRAGRFVYGGPTIDGAHGQIIDEKGQRHLVGRCLRELAACDALFAWIDREETVGTIVEITCAYLMGKPVFVAFANPELAEYFYFIKALADRVLVIDTIEPAWGAFTEWFEERRVLTSMRRVARTNWGRT
jgi:hypothetical protein